LDDLSLSLLFLDFGFDASAENTPPALGVVEALLERLLLE